MDLFDISDDFSINVNYIKGIEATKNGTKVYIELDEDAHTVNSNIPFEAFRKLLNSRKDKAKSVNVEKYLDQLAKYQTQPRP